MSNRIALYRIVLNRVMEDITVSEDPYCSYDSENDVEATSVPHLIYGLEGSPALQFSRFGTVTSSSSQLGGVNYPSRDVSMGRTRRGGNASDAFDHHDADDIEDERGGPIGSHQLLKIGAHSNPFLAEAAQLLPASQVAFDAVHHALIRTRSDNSGDRSAINSSSVRNAIQQAGLSGILKHRIFEGMERLHAAGAVAAPPAFIDTKSHQAHPLMAFHSGAPFKRNQATRDAPSIDYGSTSASFVRTRGGGGRIIAIEDQAEYDSNDSDTIPQYTSESLPQDRVRRAKRSREEGGTCCSVRISGGWMSRPRSSSSSSSSSSAGAVSAVSSSYAMRVGILSHWNCGGYARIAAQYEQCCQKKQQSYLAPDIYGHRIGVPTLTQPETAVASLTAYIPVEPALALSPVERMQPRQQRTAEEIAEAETIRRRVLAKLQGMKGPQRVAKAHRNSSRGQLEKAGNTQTEAEAAEGEDEDEGVDAPWDTTLSARFKRDVVEAAVLSAQSSSQRRKPHSLSDVALAKGVQQRKTDALEQLLETYLGQPSLSMLPVEDGGLRYATVVAPLVPRSLHRLCSSDLLCGFCFNFNSVEKVVAAASTAQLSSASTARAGAGAAETDGHSLAAGSGKGGRKKRKRGSATASGTVKSKRSQQVVPVPAEQDCLDFVDFVAGAVTYRLHKQCAHAASHPLPGIGELSALNPFNPLLGNQQGQQNKQEQEKEQGYELNPTPQQENALVSGSGTSLDSDASIVQLGSIHQYSSSKADDAQCDLCGRSGGVMRSFTIAPQVCATPAPDEDGWLAHDPCLFFALQAHLWDPLAPLKPTHRCGWDHFDDLVGTDKPLSACRLVMQTMDDTAAAAAGTTLNFLEGERDLLRCRIAKAVSDSPLPSPAAEMAVPSFSSSLSSASRSSSVIADAMEFLLCKVVARQQGTGQHVSSFMCVNASTAGAARQSIRAGGVLCTASPTSDSTSTLLQDQLQIKEPNRHEEAFPIASYEQHSEENVQPLKQNQKQNQKQEGLDQGRGHGQGREQDEQTKATPPRSRFDQFYRRWRCALCGLQSGVALRCLSAGCTVRAHALCVAIAPGDWQLYMVRLQQQQKQPLQGQHGMVGDSCHHYTGSGSSSSSETLGFLCSLHSPSPLELGEELREDDDPLSPAQG